MVPNTNSGRTQAAPRAASTRPTAVLVLSDGTVFKGRGFGAAVTNVGEVCFNTSMTGYQEIMTDPSYAGQVITFTFPHIGNVGATGRASGPHLHWSLKWNDARLDPLLFVGPQN